MKVSGEIMALARKYADKFEQWGIDEAFLDVSDSIGVGPNKLVAKVASDFQKPDGLTIVKGAEVEKFLDPLPVRKLLWVGRKTEARLKELGVNTIGDLARYDPSALTSLFGVMGLQMHLMAKGIDKSEVEERIGVKSVSHETTFEEDIADSTVIFQALDTLCEDVLKETLKQHLLFKTVTVKIRYQGFETHTRSKTLPFLANRLRDLQKIANELLFTYLCKDRKVRLIGVRVSSLVSGEKQRTLV
jgi:DNA polymerase IV (DinB-like DNA polymerase)